LKVLAIRAGALGDTIVTLPAIAALVALPAHVELVGMEPFVRLALDKELAVATHSIDRARFRALFDAGVDDTELVEFLRRFDTVIAWSRMSLLAAKLQKLQVDLLQSSPLPPPGMHASDHLLELLEPLGIHGPAPAPRIRVDDQSWSGAFASRRFIAIHPSSGSTGKNWPSECFESVARLGRSAGLDVVWIQGEADADVVPPLVRAVPGPVAHQLPLRELAGVLSASSVFVGNDSGVSHLAAAVGAPTVAVFRSTDPTQWAPRGPRVRLANTGVSPEVVWGFARELMSRL
jgi:heptosyltransferase-3